MALTSRIHRERRPGAAWSDVKAASREHQEKRLVELSLQKTLLDSLAAQEKVARNCFLLGPSEDAGQAP